jgi:hypothetical protein
MVAAATVLDFGGLPVEAPMLGEVWPTDHRESHGCGLSNLKQRAKPGGYDVAYESLASFRRRQGNKTLPHLGGQMTVFLQSSWIAQNNRLRFRA